MSDHIQPSQYTQFRTMYTFDKEFKLIEDGDGF